MIEISGGENNHLVFALFLAVVAHLYAHHIRVGLVEILDQLVQCWRLLVKTLCIRSPGDKNIAKMAKKTFWQEKMIKVKQTWLPAVSWTPLCSRVGEWLGRALFTELGSSFSHTISRFSHPFRFTGSWSHPQKPPADLLLTASVPQ